MKTVKHNYLILFFLALIFICPGIAAYLFFNHPQWLGTRTLNKGKLLNPPELLANFNSKPKWRLILWYPDRCEQNCRQYLDELGRIRLGLGRRLYDVEEWLVINDKDNAKTRSLEVGLREEDIHVLSLTAKEQAHLTLLSERAQIFIANPRDYLVLAYELNTKPEDIFHDLGQLLQTSVKSG